MVRYTLFQLPELAVVMLLAWASNRYWGAPGWLALAAVGVWIAKDALLFPMVRHSYGPDDHVPGNELLGLTGRADEDLDPRGYVRVRHELWQAECAADSPPVRAGEAVRVQGIDGLTLLVVADETTGERSR